MNHRSVNPNNDDQEVLLRRVATILTPVKDIHVTHSGHYLRIVLPLLALSASTSLAGEKPEPLPVDGKVRWVYDYQEGKRLSRETGKPMFVVFRCER